jgi:hypothetical protein
LYKTITANVGKKKRLSQPPKTSNHQNPPTFYHHPKKLSIILYFNYLQRKRPENTGFKKPILSTKRQKIDFSGKKWEF